MGNGVSSDQGNLPSRGKRDVRQAVDRKQHDWSELARHPSINNQLRCLLATANSYTSRGKKWSKSAEITLTSPPLPFLLFSSLSFPPLPLEVGPPQIQLGEPQPKSNWVHFSLKIWHLLATVLTIFLRINWTKLAQNAADKITFWEDEVFFCESAHSAVLFCRPVWSSHRRKSTLLSRTSLFLFPLRGLLWLKWNGKKNCLVIINVFQWSSVWLSTRNF